MNGLSVVFNSLIVSRIEYALSSYAGFVTQADKNRVNAMLRKGKKWGLTKDEIDFDLISTVADSALFTKVCRPSHCLHFILPKEIDKKVQTYNLRSTYTKKI